jgi:hypothetical protein
MATIITREVGATAKGSPLTNAEVDANFINLNTAIGAIPPINDAVVGTTTLWSSDKINTLIGDTAAVLVAINGV